MVVIDWEKLKQFHKDADYIDLKETANLKDGDSVVIIHYPKGCPLSLSYSVCNIDDRERKYYS